MMNDEFKPFTGAQAEFIESDNSINVYFSSTKIYEAVKKGEVELATECMQQIDEYFGNRYLKKFSRLKPKDFKTVSELIGESDSEKQRKDLQLRLILVSLCNARIKRI